jgi:acyl-CoA reductase-like NAD-dependent aldehyde dehydrogenase
MECLVSSDVVSTVPSLIPNQIDGKEEGAAAGGLLVKLDPHSGDPLWELARSQPADVEAAVSAAASAQPGWAATPPVQRGAVLHAVCNLLEQRADVIATIVARETGKSPKEALGEVAGAVALGRFYAGEGQRLYGRTTTSGTPDKYSMTVRVPVGVAGLVIAANTPIANVAWKVFPALICGNAAVLKAAEDTPATAWAFAGLAADAGLPPGTLNVVQGLGVEAGAPLVADPRVGVVSFTGSTAVGREIGRVAGERLAKVSLELGGKNPFIVCDDADLDRAVTWAALSAFSNAGQRCAAASRLVVFDGVYDEFVERLVRKIDMLRVGNTDTDDLGPVINERALDRILGAVASAHASGAQVLRGGERLSDAAHRGFYVAPTLVEAAPADSAITTSELFGPVAALYRVADFEAALQVCNASDYGLTAAIHTRSWDRAMQFAMHVRSGVAVVNAGTYGSEPHMPFGGVGSSGNGSREPGTEALDIYSDLRDLYLNVDPAAL